MTKDLTEKWKSGELEIDDKVMKHLTREIKLTTSKDDLIKYLEDKAWTFKEENAKLNEHIEKLEELLKECRDEIASIDYDSPVDEREQNELLTKIDEVLNVAEDKR